MFFQKRKVKSFHWKPRLTVAAIPWFKLHRTNHTFVTRFYGAGELKTMLSYQNTFVHRSIVSVKASKNTRTLSVECVICSREITIIFQLIRYTLVILSHRSRVKTVSLVKLQYFDFQLSRDFIFYCFQFCFQTVFDWQIKNNTVIIWSINRN